MKFLTLETISPQGSPHTSSVSLSDARAKVLGALPHQSEFVASETNVASLRKLADYLDRRVKARERARIKELAHREAVKARYVHE